MATLIVGIPIKWKIGHKAVAHKGLGVSANRNSQSAKEHCDRSACL